MICNRFKGSDLGSITDTGVLIRFCNFKADIWREHFRLLNSEIIPLTEIGILTAKIFRFNDFARKAEREGLQELGLYPKS